jgi:hypothetical protein
MLERESQTQEAKPWSKKWIQLTNGYLNNDHEHRLACYEFTSTETDGLSGQIRCSFVYLVVQSTHSNNGIFLRAGYPK